MKFQIDHSSENGLKQLRLQNLGEKTVVSVLPEHGALLHSFEVVLNKKRFNIIDNYQNSHALRKELGLSYKSAKLSPFACRIPGGKYNFNGIAYEIERKFTDGSAIHGLLFNKTFQVVDKFADDNTASVLMKYHYEKEDHGYPFDYACEVHYSLLEERTLQVKTTVTNLGKDILPIADGWHPYFKLDGKVNDWWMQFSSETILEFNDQLIPTGKLIFDDRFNKPRLIGNTALDNCFLLRIDESVPCCVLQNPKNGLTLFFYTDQSYPYLQIYIPPSRESIAIENLSAAPDSFNNGMGLVKLLPGHSHVFNVWYQLTLQ